MIQLLAPLRQSIGLKIIFFKSLFRAWDKTSAVMIKKAGDGQSVTTKKFPAQIKSEKHRKNSKSVGN